MSNNIYDIQGKIAEEEAKEVESLISFKKHKKREKLSEAGGICNNSSLNLYGIKYELVRLYSVENN